MKFELGDHVLVNGIIYEVTDQNRQWVYLTCIEPRRYLELVTDAPSQTKVGQRRLRSMQIPVVCGMRRGDLKGRHSMGVLGGPSPAD